jgi:uncharacterized protein (TIGR02147 family)
MDKARAPAPTIYEYLDYRHFLADLFESLRADDSSMSFRSFARMAGSSSPNYLQLIRDRKLNIGAGAIHALSRALHLPAKERKYLEYLAAFDHAKTHEEKDRWFRIILIAREYTSVRSLDKKQYDLFSHWYIPVIRELLVQPSLKGDPARIGEAIIPPVSTAKVRKAIDLLVSLGLVVATGDGGWAQAARAVSTPSEVLSLAVTTYHKKVIELAGKAIERFAPDERDIRSVTLGVSREGYAEVKMRMEAFWKELLAFSETQKTADRVYQVNLQLFPMSITEVDPE